MPDQPSQTSARNRTAARVSLSAAFAALSDYALAAVPTRADEHVNPAEWGAIVRRAKLILQDVQWRAVVLMRESECTWDEVAHALGYQALRDGRTAGEFVRELFEPAYEQWRAGGKRQHWHPQWLVTGGIVDSDDTDAVAAALDDWYRARHGGLTADPSPVTGGLRL